MNAMALRDALDHLLQALYAVTVSISPAGNAPSRLLRASNGSRMTAA